MICLCAKPYLQNNVKLRPLLFSSPQELTKTNYNQFMCQTIPLWYHQTLLFDLVNIQTVPTAHKPYICGENWVFKLQTVVFSTWNIFLLFSAADSQNFSNVSICFNNFTLCHMWCDVEEMYLAMFNTAVYWKRAFNSSSNRIHWIKCSRR
jgi:hypothetical protein